MPTRIHGADDIQEIRLVAVRAACQVTGPDRTAGDVKDFASEFTRWLRDARDDVDREVRFQVLLTVTANMEGYPDRPAKVVKLADDLRSYVG